jgi:hypothetical protein
LLSQHVNWFKRAAKSTRDNWRYDLAICGSGNCFTPDLEMLDLEQNPILFRLVDSFAKFSALFYKRDNNFLQSFVLNNPCITTADGFPYNLNTKFWTSNGRANLYNLSKIRISDNLTDYE